MRVWSPLSRSAGEGAERSEAGEGFAAGCEQELEASIAADLDDVHEPIDWTRAVKGMPPRKHDIHIRLDEDVLDWFRQAGRGYQTRINNVLRAFMESRKRAPR